MEGYSGGMLPIRIVQRKDASVHCVQLTCLSREGVSKAPNQQTDPTFQCHNLIQFDTLPRRSLFLIKKNIILVCDDDPAGAASVPDSTNAARPT